jgi:hypothetical protein
MVVCAADQTACRLSAEDLPVLRSATTSKAIFCPSLRARMPARSTALICTKTSLPPSSGWIKPKPFWSLKNFTVPCVIQLFFQIRVMKPHTCAAGSFEIWRKVVSPTRDVRRSQVVRPKLDHFIWGLSAGSQGLAGKSLEKKLAISPTSPHVGVACRISSPLLAMAPGHEDPPNSDHRHRPGESRHRLNVGIPPFNDFPIFLSARWRISQARRSASCGVG